MITRDNFNVNHAVAACLNSTMNMFQRADIVPTPTQPIPAPVGPAHLDVDTKDIIEQEDSITEEITELRTAESPHREWVRILLISIVNYLLMLLIISLCWCKIIENGYNVIIMQYAKRTIG